MYVYTPYEPHAVPTQGAPDLRAAEIASVFDLYTEGYCGNCPRCPKVWKFRLTGGYGPLSYEGDYYLRRNPYRYEGSATNYRYALCSWESGIIWGPDGCPINGANLNTPQNRDDDQHEWTLTFEYLPEGGGYGWYLRTPFHDDGLHTFQSLYSTNVGIRGWSSCGANTFYYHTNLAEFNYQYLPPSIEIVPFYA